MGPGVVVCGAGGHGHEFSIPRIGIVDNRSKYPEEDEETSHDVSFCPPGCGERTDDKGDLCPVECDDAHSEASLIAEELVDDDVVWGNPTGPSEVAESLEEVTGHKVP